MRDRPNDTHRNVAKATAGRTLTPNDVVDHVDENKANNTAANLRVMPRGKHTAMHNKQRGLSKLRSALRSFKEGRKAY